MSFTQEMYQYVIKKNSWQPRSKLPGDNSSTGQEIGPRLDYFELFKKYTDIDLEDSWRSRTKKFTLIKNHIKYEQAHSKGRLIDLIFKKKIRILPEISAQPAFLINQPVELEPLAKRDPKKPQSGPAHANFSLRIRIGQRFWRTK